MYSRAVLVFVAVFALASGSAAAGERDGRVKAAVYSNALWQDLTLTDSLRSSQYAAAMLNYRQIGLTGGPPVDAYPLLPGTTKLDELAWVWVAPDGSHVQRLNRGLFRIYQRDPTANWYRTVDCRALQWPNFVCSDGREREMSAPTTTRIVFDGANYERAFARNNSVFASNQN
jgi:hypothetical protein